MLHLVTQLIRGLGSFMLLGLTVLTRQQETALITSVRLHQEQRFPLMLCK